MALVILLLDGSAQCILEARKHGSSFSVAGRLATRRRPATVPCDSTASSTRVLHGDCSLHHSVREAAKNPTIGFSSLHAIVVPKISVKLRMTEIRNTTN